MADENEDPPSATVQMPRVRRRAPTIELKATEVAVEQPAAAETGTPVSDNPVPPEYSTEPPPSYDTGADSELPPEPPPTPPHDPAWRSFIGRPVVEAGLAGALVAIVIFVVLWLGGMFSGNDDSGSGQRLASMEARLREMSSRPAQPNPDARMIEDLTGRLGRLEAAPRNTSAAGLDEAIKPLRDAIADLTRRVEDNATAIREARGRADAAQEAARAATDRSNVDALNSRLAALEQASKVLNEDTVKNLAAAGDKPLRAAVAAQALQAAVERGDPFAAELSAVKAVTANPQMLAALEPFAASGLPSAAVLARQLSGLAPTMLKAVVAPAPAGGFLDRLQANAEKLVRIRPIDEVPGDEPAAVISRAQGKASRGDLAGASAELKALPADVRAPAEDWIKKADARNAAIVAGRRVVTDALAALGKTSP